MGKEKRRWVFILAGGGSPSSGRGALTQPQEGGESPGWGSPKRRDSTSPAHPAAISPAPPSPPTYPLPPGSGKLSAAAGSGTARGPPPSRSEARGGGLCRRRVRAGAAPPPLCLPLANAGCAAAALRWGRAGAGEKLWGLQGERRSGAAAAPPAEGARELCKLTAAAAPGWGTAVKALRRGWGAAPARLPAPRFMNRGAGGRKGGRGWWWRKGSKHLRRLRASLQPPPGWSNQIPRSPAVPLSPAALPQPRRAHPGREAHRKQAGSAPRRALGLAPSRCARLRFAPFWRTPP